MSESGVLNRGSDCDTLPGMFDLSMASNRIPYVWSLPLLDLVCFLPGFSTFFLLRGCLVWSVWSAERERVLFLISFLYCDGRERTFNS